MRGRDISALCIGGQFLAAISSAAISEAAYCGDPYFTTPGISRVLENIATKFQQLSPCFRGQPFNGATIRHRVTSTSTRNARRRSQNEMYLFYGCMAGGRQFLILSERTNKCPRTQRKQIGIMEHVYAR